jgi:hypothetical protein
MTCTVCGCHDLQACATVRGGIEYRCFWVAEDLCSFCALKVPGEDRMPVRGVDVVTAFGGIL